MTLEQLDIVLLSAAGILLLAVVAVRFSVGLGLPSLLFYLAIGWILGTTELVSFNDMELAEVLGVAALIVILAEGGITTRWRAMKPVIGFATSLATIGVAVSVLILAVVAYALLDVSWQLAVLCGAVLSTTDAAAVFSVLRRVPLRSSVSGPLEVESGFNDAPVIILVLLMSKPGDAETWYEILGQAAYQLIIGAAIGVAVGWLGARILTRTALPASGLYPIAVMTFAVLAYAVGAGAHASGFVAVFLAGVVLGNSDIPHRGVSRGFAEALAWVAQIGLFVMLGLLVTPMRRLPETLVPALVIGLALLLIARPVSVFVAALPFRVPFREQAFIAWAGLRGAVPIVLAIIPVVHGVPGSRSLLDVVFVVVVVFTLVQGPTMPLIARWLRVGSDTSAVELSVEAAPLDKVAADLLHVTIPPGSRLRGVEVAELRLPPGASVSLVVRDGASLVPGPTTSLRVGDDLLVVVPRELREETERRLTNVSTHGRMAGWLGAQQRRRTPAS